MLPKTAHTQAFILALAVAASSAAGAAVIYSNNPTPGDNFTSVGARIGEPVGASDWYYNNVGGGGSVGINIIHPRSGNGSVGFSGTGSPSKADIEYLPGAILSGGTYYSTASLGLFSDLTSFSYDWWRNGTSTNPAGQQPSLRVLLDRDGDLTTTADRGGLIFEAVYNGMPAAPTDQWVTSTIGGSTNLWNTGLGLGFADDFDGSGSGYDQTLADWQDFLGPNAVIIGFSSGIGSGWDHGFSGAVDNISWTIADVTTTTNFEVRPLASTVPEPGSLALIGLGLIGLAVVRRRTADKRSS